jgi:probable addiction module antidote protein
MAVKGLLKRKSPAGSTFNETVIQMLKNDPAFREEYIRETLKEDDPQMLILSLRKVIDAMGGVGVLSKETNLNRTQLYRTLSKQGKPEYFTLTRILNYLGLHFSVERNKKRVKGMKLQASCR